MLFLLESLPCLKDTVHNPSDVSVLARPDVEADGTGGAEEDPTIGEAGVVRNEAFFVSEADLPTWVQIGGFNM